MKNLYEDDVLVCNECGHTFRDTAYELGWQRHRGRIVCKRCVADGLDNGLSFGDLVVIVGIVLAIIVTAAWWFIR